MNHGCFLYHDSRRDQSDSRTARELHVFPGRGRKGSPRALDHHDKMLWEGYMSWPEDVFLSPVSQWVSDLFYVCHSGRLFHMGDCLGQHCPLDPGLLRPSEGNSLEPVDRALGQGPAGRRGSCQTLCLRLSPPQGSSDSSPPSLA